MQNYKDLEIPLDLTLPHVRKFTKIIYPGIKLFTEEQVQHLISIRAEMKSGLTWKELEERYTAPEEIKPKHEPPSDSAIQEVNQENVREFKQKIRGVSNRVVGSMVAKDAIDFTRNLPLLSFSANLQAVRHDELMEDSFNAVYQAIDSEPQGNYIESVDMVAELVDSAYEQGRRITGTTSHGDFAALEAAEEDERQE